MTDNAPSVTVVHDGFRVTTNEGGSEEEVLANLESEPAPLDGEPVDPEVEDKEKARKAAAELGKRGGKASAEARAAAAENKEEQEEKTAAPAEGEGEEAPAKGGEAGPEEKTASSRAKARIEEVTRQRAEERRAREAAEARAAELEARLARLQGPPPGQGPGPQEGEQGRVTREQAAPGRPRREDFGGDDEAYVEAVAEYKARDVLNAQLRVAYLRHAAQARAEETEREVDAFRERVLAAPEILEMDEKRPIMQIKPSFTLRPDERVGPLNILADELIKSQQVARLMTYLDSHPEEFQRIEQMGMDARRIAMTVAKLEARFEAEQAAAAATPPPPAQQSSAKPPVRPITTTPGGAEDLLGDDTDFETHYRVMQARDGRRRKGR